MLNRVVRSLMVLGVFAAQMALAQSDKPVADGVQAVERGSRISVQQLSPMQVENLAVAGKVWGFLKYHHPVVTSGQRQWDYALLDILPAVLAARDRAGADALLVEWIAGLGPLPDCNPCARLDPQGYHLLPRLGWLEDKSLLSPGLRDALQTVYRKRSSAKTQFYAGFGTTSGNPVFDKEADYKSLTFPDAGFQLLSLLRFWNIVEYWSPYRDQVDADWDTVLRESIAPVMQASSRSAYELAMIVVTARVNDTHTKLYTSLPLAPPRGGCRVPVHVRFVEEQAVVAGYTDNDAGPASGLRRGDVIEAIDGKPLAALIDAWRPYYAASNEPTRLRDIAMRLTGGACGPAQLTVRQDGQRRELAVVRMPIGRSAPLAHDRPGETFQLLGDDIAYIKLSSIRSADIPGYMQRAAQTRGIIIDIRNYPSEYVPLWLGPYFVDKPTPFVRTTMGDAANPGGFTWRPETSLPVHPSPYRGKVMVLVDEESQSRSEYTAMALRAGPRARVIGSTTAGADGNASRFSLPGGLQTMISGLGVFYPDKRPTQRIGIVPDIRVAPTIEGIRAGRDEVLDAAINEIRSN